MRGSKSSGFARSGPDLGNIVRIRWAPGDDIFCLKPVTSANVKLYGIGSLRIRMLSLKSGLYVRIRWECVSQDR